MNIDRIQTAIAGKTVARIVRKSFWNEQFKAQWEADCIEFSDGTFLAICSDDEPEYIILEK